jgi:hypothetical protein
MSDQGKQQRVQITFQDGSTLDLRNAMGIQFTEYGSMEVIRPTQCPNGAVLIPWVPNNFVKYAMITEEPIQAVRSTIPGLPKSA